jgi:hypothetical protein
VQGLVKKQNKEDMDTLPHDGAEQIKSLAEICFSLSRLQLMTKSMSRENRILRRLCFESIYAREDAIAKAESGTFRWILEETDYKSSEVVKDCMDESEDTASEGIGSSYDEEDVRDNQKGANIEDKDTGHEDKQSSRGEEDETSTSEYPSSDGTESSGASEDETQSDDATSLANRQDCEELPRNEREMRKRTRDSFLTWLKSGGQVYHISGKAGSGKSTLMKFLCQNPRVQQELGSWAGDKKLVFAHFFFWNSGDKLQMSLEGLYRAILFETLKQYPELIPEIFPDQWDAFESEVSGLESTLFRFPQIKAAFDTLIGKRAFPKHRFCFFIDGLDEYEGDSVDHWKLAESLQNWANSEDIKVCVSSRPHTEFLDTFSDDPDLRIHLHELTRGDISRFARAMFEKDRSFSRVQDSYLHLVHSIVGMAEGVFLWARLVVRSLLSGIGHNDPTSVLQEKLKATPKGLDDLFNKLLGAIDPGDRKRSDKMLLIATLNPRWDSLNALIYSWLEDLEDPNFPFNLPVQGYSDEEIKRRHQDLRRQLDSLSKGLLEITTTTYNSDIFFKYKVQFFHRTVRDYLQDSSRQIQMKSRLPGFDITETYFRLFLAVFKFARTKKVYLEERYPPDGNPLFDWFIAIMDWLDTSGQELPFNFTEELGRVLDSYRRLPFSHPEETEKNVGRVLWGAKLDSSIYTENSQDDISYLHTAAWYCQHRYVSQKVSQDPNLVKGSNDLSLLLSAAVGPDPELVHFLLERGELPSEKVKIWQIDNSAQAEKTATIWMVFLFAFAHSTLNRTDYWPSFDRSSLVLEQFLKFGADSDIFFLVCDEEKDLDQITDDELFFITLQQLVHMGQPPNFESIQNLHLGGARRQLWIQTTRVISRLTPWIRSSTSVTSKYKAFESNELGNGKYKLHSVCSKTSRLQKGFFVKIY